MNGWRSDRGGHIVTGTPCSSNTHSFAHYLLLLYLASNEQHEAIIIFSLCLGSLMCARASRNRTKHIWIEWMQYAFALCCWARPIDGEWARARTLKWLMKHLQFIFYDVHRNGFAAHNRHQAATNAHGSSAKGRRHSEIKCSNILLLCISNVLANRGCAAAAAAMPTTVHQISWPAKEHSFLSSSKRLSSRAARHNNSL